ncbi:MAG: sterol desaturase family protein [Sphingobacteriia bacterium]|nr:sterol desaturase family protein [Sphingobacteriia bacterium]
MNSFWQHFSTTLQTVSLRYFLFAGTVWLVWYVLLKKKISFKKIQLRFPNSKDYRREIFYSVITMIIFALVPAFILGTPVRQYTFFYKDIHQYGMLWFWAAFPLMFLVHDTYFYWTHRLMHHPALFKTFHLLHHKSTNPSPWAAYAFYPTEAVVEAGIFIVFVFIMPITFWHLFFFFLFMIVYNVYGHLGWEIYPKGFNKHWLGRWINTSVNHNQHHQHFKGNYGLYFLWWDRWMGTLRNDYDLKFEEVKNRLPHLKTV